MPLKATAVAPVKLVPLTATTVPTAPLAGLNPVTVGGGSTVKVLALAAVPPGVVTLIGPLVAPPGTAALIWVADATVYVAATPLKATALAPTRPVPLSVTGAPTAPLVGLKATSVGDSDGVPATTRALLGTAAVGPTPVIVGVTTGERLGDWTMVNFLQRHVVLRPPRTPISACQMRSRSDALAGQENFLRTRPKAHANGAEDPGSPRKRQRRACCARTAICIVPPDAGTGSGRTRTTTGPKARGAAASLGAADHSPSPGTSAPQIIAVARDRTRPHRRSTAQQRRLGATRPALLPDVRGPLTRCQG